jgi:hypothetical protein
MKKVYILEYDWTGGSRIVQHNNIFEFAMALDQVLSSPHTITGTIKVFTEEIKTNTL